MNHIRLATAVLSLAACLAAAQTASPEAVTREGAATPLPAVFGENRSPAADLIIMRPETEGAEEQRLVGDLLEPLLTLQAPYVRLDLPAERIAGIQAGDPDDPERLFDTLTTVNGDQFSGLLLTPSLRFRLQGGGEISVRRELIALLIRRIDPNETKGIPIRQQFRLHGGDHFSGGLLLDQPLTLAAGYGQLSLALADLRAIRLPAEGGPAQVESLSGAVMTGGLDPARFPVELDCTAGLSSAPAEFTLYVGRIEVLQCQPGPLEGALVSSAPSNLALPDAVELTTDGAHHSADLTQAQIDEYWFRAQQGQTYTATTSNVSGADSVMELLATDGAAQLQRDDDSGINMGSRISWTCPQSGTYYLRVWQYGGGEQFLSQFPNATLPPGYASSLSTGTYEIWIDAGVNGVTSSLFGIR